MFLSVLSHLPGEDTWEARTSFPARKVYRVILEPLYLTQLSVQVESPVIKISKRMGDRFKEGDVLVQLDGVIFLGNLVKAKAVLEKAQVKFDAKKELFEKDIASHFDYADAKAELAEAKANLILAKKTLEMTKILAPYNGKVVGLSIEEHELPKSGSEVIEVVDDTVLLAKFLVSSSLLSEMVIGNPIYIKLAETGEIVEAKISRVGAVIEPSSSTIQVEAEIDNADGKLRAGMSGKASISLEALKAERSVESLLDFYTPETHSPTGR